MATSNTKKTYRLGENINILLEFYGETQLELAHRIGLESPNTISKSINNPHRFTIDSIVLCLS